MPCFYMGRNQVSLNILLLGELPFRLLWQYHKCDQSRDGMLPLSPGIGGELCGSYILLRMCPRQLRREGADEYLRALP